MKRRDFLIQATVAAGVASQARLWAQDTTKRARVAVLSRNFDAIIKQGDGPKPGPGRTLDFMDLPQMIADRFGVHNLELQHSHFVSTEPSYLKDFRDRVAKAKSQVVQINTDFQGSNVSAGGFSQRAQGVDLAKVWIDHAEAVGCTRLVINPGNLADATRQTTVEALKGLAEYAKTHNITIAIENREPVAAPPPSPPQAAGAAGAAQAAQGRRGGGGGQGQGGANTFPGWQAVVDVIKAGGITALPDAAGFSSDAERSSGLKVLYPLSNGNSRLHPGPSLAAAVRISKDLGYKGMYALAADPSAADPYAATRAMLDEVAKLI
jgi:hypothetical protein